LTYFVENTAFFIGALCSGHLYARFSITSSAFSF